MTTRRRRPHDELDREIVDLLMRLIGTYKERFAATLGLVDLTTSQGNLLVTLQEPTPMNELARRLGFDASHITAIVDQLEERGLVERQSDASDRRVKRITVTPPGLALREQIRDHLYESMFPLAPLSAAQRTQLRDLLAAALSPGGDNDGARTSPDQAP